MDELVPKREKRSLMDISGVISVGESIEDGHPIVVVTLDADDPGVDPARVPDEIRGHPVRIEFGEIPRVGQELPQKHRSRCRRPVMAGTIVSGHCRANGTLGFYMTDGQDVYVASNNHVIACEDGVEPGAGVYQPAHVTERKKIAELTGYIPIENGITVDLAWAKIDRSHEFVNEIFEYGVPQGRREPEIGDEIAEIGLTTDVTRGEVTQVNKTVMIDFSKGLTRVEDVADGSYDEFRGDSGGPVMHDDGSMDIAGMHFAGSGLFCTIDNIEAASGLTAFTGEATIGTQAEQVCGVFDPGLVNLRHCDADTTTLGDGDSTRLRARVHYFGDDDPDITVEWKIGDTVVGSETKKFTLDSRPFSTEVTYETLLDAAGGSGEFTLTAEAFGQAASSASIGRALRRVRDIKSIRL